MTNTKIGFLVPMEKEAVTLVRALTRRKSSSIKGRKVVTGNLGKTKCAIVISGTGKVRSASGTQLLLDQFGCKRVVHFGSGGALSSDLQIGDFVVGTDVVEHDFYCRFGEKESNPVAVCDKPLANTILKYADKQRVRTASGRIVSGNEDVVTTSRRDELWEQFGGISVDWESAGCALVCNINRAPVVIIRGISDFAYEKTHDEYSQNAVNVCAQISEFLIHLFESKNF
jgi:adenosylhomocysteine nucleosidase